MVLALAGAGAVLYATAWGLGASPDSAAYIGVARNLLAGRGLGVPFGQTADVPLTHFPPLYSLALALVGGLSGTDPWLSGRWLQAALLALSVLGVGGMAYGLARRSGRAALLAGLLWMTSPALLGLYLMAWSEALFLFLGLGGLALLALYLVHPSRRLLALAALAIGLAVVTRYAGLALVATGLVALWWLSEDSRLRRLTDGVFFALLSGLPLAIWLVRNLLIGGEATGRKIAFHPLSRAHLIQGLDTVSGWLFLPASAPGWIKAGGVALLALALAIILLAHLPGRRFQGAIRLPTDDLAGALVWVLGLFLGIYVLFLVFSISLVDYNTPLDGRILAPAWAAAFLLLVRGGFLLTDRGPRPALARVAVATLGALVVGLFSVQAWATVQAAHADGLGFASRRWHESPVVAAVASLPTTTPVFSNVPDGLYLWTGRRTLSLPRPVRATSRQANERYSAEMAMVRHTLEAQGGVVVYFRDLARNATLDEDSLHTELGLHVIFNGPDGVIYGAPVAIR
ncbi:MAG: hypothetical protein KatS3mg050_0891 [Litorilinea sp.]|nr:MAG: hypothetical protein KatS3mg050_0891 [Litorilinea sp.]